MSRNAGVPKPELSGTGPAQPASDAVRAGSHAHEASSKSQPGSLTCSMTYKLGT